MQTMIPARSCQRSAIGGRLWALADQAIAAANSAKGSAKSVWLKRIISRNCRMSKFK